MTESSVGKVESTRLRERGGGGRKREKQGEGGEEEGKGEVKECSRG